MISSLQIRHLEEVWGGKATSFSLAIITVKSSLSDSLFELDQFPFARGQGAELQGGTWREAEHNQVKAQGTLKDICNRTELADT